jgi:succinyl-diaminopimelate desuccinylase
MMDFTLETCKEQIIEVLSGLLKIKSVKDDPQINMPYGKGVFDALMYMLNRSEKLDFDSVNLFSQIGYVEYGEGEDVFAILTHLDVVPAGENWTVEPFDATIRDGRIYGRGAVDDKGPAVAALFALYAIKENCKSLNKRVRVIFGCDEESGWSDMEFLKQKDPTEPVMAISPDGNFPIINAEKGLMHITISKPADKKEPSGGVVLVSLEGGDRVNVVPNFARCVLRGQAGTVLKAVDLYNEGAEKKLKAERTGDEVAISSYGQAAHGSRPQDGVNALGFLISFLNTLPLHESNLSDMVYALGEKVNTETTGARLGIAREDFSGALTLNLGALKREDAEIKAMLDIRYPVGADKEQIFSAIQKSFDGFSVEESFALPAHYVDENTEFIQKLKEAYTEVTGEPAECMSIGGATYARAFKNSVAFGPLFPGEEGTEHQPDEYINIDSLIRAGDIIANAILKLCS